MKFSPGQILDLLAIDQGDTIFIKAGLKHLGYRPADAMVLLEAILERVGSEGTILMPSFPYENHLGRPEAGFVYDVARSPSRLGMLSEMFRCHVGTKRSEQYWMPSCAWGRLAAELVSGQLHVKNPFEVDSTYVRMLQYPIKMVGLGVTLNYNIVSHVADCMLAPRFPFSLYDREPLRGVVIDIAGQSHDTETITFPQKFRSATKPSLLVYASEALRRELRYETSDGGIIFALPAQLYLQESLRIGNDALDRGELPPWLQFLDYSSLHH